MIAVLPIVQKFCNKSEEKDKMIMEQIYRSGKEGGNKKRQRGTEADAEGKSNGQPENGRNG